MKSSGFLFRALICALGLAVAPYSQSTFGSFAGTIQDQPGSAVTSATIHLTNLDENDQGRSAE